jgi:hypothetical protein
MPCRRSAALMQPLNHRVSQAVVNGGPCHWCGSYRVLNGGILSWRLSTSSLARSIRWDGRRDVGRDGRFSNFEFQWLGRYCETATAAPARSSALRCACAALAPRMTLQCRKMRTSSHRVSRQDQASFFLRASSHSLLPVPSILSVSGVEYGLHSAPCPSTRARWRLLPLTTARLLHLDSAGFGLTRLL